MATTWYVDDQGEVYQSDAADAPAKADLRGWRQVTPEEGSKLVTKRDNLRRYDTAPQQALAAADRIARSATFGLVGGQGQVAEDRRAAFAEQHPIAAVAADVAGAAVPGLGAAGLAGRGLRAAGVAGRAAGIGVDLAADAAAGLSQEAASADEQGRGIDVGSVAAWTIGGAFAGQALGAGMRWAGGRVGTREAVRETERAVVVGGATDALERGRGVARRTTDELASAGPITADRAVDMDHWRPKDPSPDRVRPSREAVVDYRANQTSNERKAALALQDSWNRVFGSSDGQVDNAFDATQNIGLKREQVAPLIQREALTPAHLAEQESIRASAYEATGLLAEAARADGKQRLAGMLDARANAIANAAEPVDLFVAVDQAKRYMGRIETETMTAARRMGDVDHAFASSIGGPRETLRKELERADAWGESAARKQARENVRWSHKDHGFIANAHYDSSISRIKDKKTLDGFATYEADIGGIQSLMGASLEVQQEAYKKLNRKIEAAAELGRVKLAEGVDRAEQEAFLADVDDLRLAVKNLEHHAQATHMGKAIKADVAPEGVARKLAGIAGDAISGVPIIGRAVSGAKRFAAPEIAPAAEAYDREAARAWLRRDLSAAGSVARRERSARLERTAQWASETGIPAARRAAVVAAGAAADRYDSNSETLASMSDDARQHELYSARDFGSPSDRSPVDSVASFAAGYGSLGEAYRNKMALLSRYGADPEALAQDIARAYGDLAETHPEAMAEIGAVAVRAIGYMTEHMPAGVAYSIADPMGLPVSQSAQRDFARLWQAVMAPHELMTAIAQHQATPEQMRAVQAVHPEVYAGFQRRVMESLSARGTPPPYETQRYTDQLLGLNGAWNQAFSPRTQSALAAAIASAPGAAEQAGNAPARRNGADMAAPVSLAAARSGPTNR